MKHILKMNEDSVENYDTTYQDNFSKAYDNTKSFDISNELDGHIGWLNGCKNCNEITDMIFTKYSGQYEILCICKKCGNYVLFDRDKDALYDHCMKLKLQKDMNKYNI